MKPRSRGKHKGRSEFGGGFSGIPHAVMDSGNWRLCGSTALRLLLAMVRQYRGTNNGDLCAALGVVGRYGFTRSATTSECAKELCHYGFLRLTRQGGLHQPNLYAITWKSIDECGGKLDCPPTSAPSGDWKEPREPFKRPPKKRGPTTPAVTARYAYRSDGPKRAA